MPEPILEVSDLKKHFPVTRGLVWMKKIGAVKAVDGVSFSIRNGDTFGLVGESGCGKTTVSRLILLLHSITAGSILFSGKNIEELSAQELREYRGSVQAVFQDPYGSLSPRMKVGEIISEPIIVNRDLSAKAVKERVADLLSLVSLSPQAGELYPHEFSGGQRQRIAVARAIALDPKLIILDEPVSALDVSIQAQIMNLLKDLQERMNLSYLLIAHDLGVVKHMSTVVGVMYLGKLVELAESDELYANPLHPYTRALFSAALPTHPDMKHEQIVLQGDVPSPLNPPPGCAFHPRCFDVKEGCAECEPMLKDVGAGHLVACCA